MNTCHKFTRMRVLGLAVLLLGLVSSAQAQQRITLLASEGFSSWPPAGWTCTAYQQYGGWYQSANGYNGTNGSAVCDVWDYSSAPLTTPSMDASAMAFSNDSVTLDFDFCWQYNGYNAAYGDDNFQILANADVLMNMSTSANKTYSTTNYSYDVDPPTAAGSWKHYRIVIPVKDRTSKMTISFQGAANQGLSNPAIDNVSITGVLFQPSQLALSAKTINFGSVAAGQSSTICLTASSLGPATLKILSTQLQGSPDFSLSPGYKAAGDSIVAGANSSYCFTFTPLSAGGKSSTFTLTTNGRDSGIQQVTIVGQGIAPGVSYGATSMFRKVTTRLGDTSVTKYLTITSNGSGPLTINSVTFAGLNPNQYFVSRIPVGPIQTGQTDSIGIRFAPTFEGRPDAQVIINTNALNKPLDTVNLFGVGILPRLAFTNAAGMVSNTVHFDSVAIGDSVCQVMTLSNPGSDTLRITRQLKSSGDFDFAFYPLTGSDTAIAPNQTKAFNVCFTPLKNGSRQATYRFYTNIPRSFPGPGDSSQIILNITGVGVPVGRLAFAGARIDSEIIGTKGCQDVKVSNVGLSDFTVMSVAISGLNASDFTDNITTPLVIPAGGSQTVNICFTPTGRGARTGTVTVIGSSAGRNQTIAVPLAGVGLQQCASAAPMSLFSTPTLVGSTDTAVVTVTNCGDVATSYTTNLTGTGYTVTPATSGAVAAGGTAKFVVHYTPTTLTNNAGTLVVNGGAGITPMTVTLGGSGGGVALNATGNAGQVAKGNCKNFDIAVTNTGNVAWTPNGGSISGANGSDFTIVSSPSSVGANGGTGTITIKFCPKIVGSESANLNYTGTPMPLSGGTIVLSGSGVVNAVSSPVVDRGYELDQSYPNPAKSVADVRFVLPTEAVVHITLMDATGATVRTVANERFSGGEHAVSIDTHDLASGTYFYVLSSDGVQLTKQMTVVK